MATLTDLVHEMFSSIDRDDRDHVRSLIDTDCEFIAPGLVGKREEGLAFMAAFLDAFPGIQHRVASVVESGDRVSTELEITGVHTAPLIGAGGAIPPTGKGITLLASNTWVVRDGIIRSYHVYFDTASLMQQLGIMG